MRIFIFLLKVGVIIGGLSILYIMLFGGNDTTSVRYKGDKSNASVQVKKQIASGYALSQNNLQQLQARKHFMLKVSGQYSRKNKETISALCLTGEGIKGWGKVDYLACMGAAANNSDICKYVPKYIANAEDSQAIVNAKLACIQNVIRFSSARIEHTSCEPLKDYIKTRPDAYINCRAWLDMKPERCDLMQKYYANNPKEANGMTVTCLLDLAQYSRDKSHCTRAAQYFSNYADNINIQNLVARIQKCPDPY